MSAAPPLTPYFRRDQVDGITPPNLADQSTYAEHIVHARGKRTRFTSVSTDPATIVFPRVGAPGRLRRVVS